MSAEQPPGVPHGRVPHPNVAIFDVMGGSTDVGGCGCLTGHRAIKLPWIRQLWNPTLAHRMRKDGAPGGFELHLGTISLGCINADKRNPAAAQQYQQLNQLLQSENGSNYLTVVP